MKKFTGMMLVLAVLGLSGCAQKSESEKMMDQMHRDAKKATSQMKKDINNL